MSTSQDGQSGVERRRGRRILLEAPLRVQRIGDQPEPFVEQVTGNVSLAGAYFETEAGHAYAINDQVMTSIAIPEQERRAFPFTRLAGRSRVVRVDELPPGRGTAKRFGVALEFGDDFLALTAIPTRG